MSQRNLFAAVCLCATLLSGCAAFDAKPDGQQAGDPEWLEDLKAISGTGPSIGISREAREIERSLGARQ